ncbi:hypothetical protein EDB92DRAFT_1072738 [Lactarius akahatsu]|uniref:Secreted protein n=1 Tax=Lactarius akahatsu TaxID=416441 RepID=A0AAD4QBW0_9AGAM|nr:hypothetical protein EDB92DRAFT_1072738 [Lactarius akahatsu]
MRCLTRRRVMLIVSSVQFSLATGHAMPLLVQLIRVFTGTVGCLDRPSLYPIACRQTTLYCNHCQSHRGRRLDLALMDDLGPHFLRPESQVTLPLSTLPRLPNGYHLPLACPQLADRDSIQRISKASERRVSTCSRSS